MRREKQLALKMSAHIQERCHLLDKLSQLQKEHQALESALKEACLEEEALLEEEARQAQHLEVACKQVARDRAKLQKQIPLLLREVQEEQSRFQQQQRRMGEISHRIWALAEESKLLTAQVPKPRQPCAKSGKKASRFSDRSSCVPTHHLSHQQPAKVRGLCWRSTAHLLSWFHLKHNKQSLEMYFIRSQQSLLLLNLII